MVAGFVRAYAGRVRRAFTFASSNEALIGLPSLERALEE
jgi:hypothetical protein